MMGMIIVRFACPIICFVMFYTVAFISHRGYREDDDILFISESQWEAIFILMLLTLITIFKE